MKETTKGVKKMKETIQIRIPVEDLAALKDKAWENRASTSEYLRKLIRECAETDVVLHQEPRQISRTTALIEPEDGAWLRSKASELNISVDKVLGMIVRRALHKDEETADTH